MLEVDGVATENAGSFPFSGMRILGSIQLSIGLLVFGVGVADLVVTMTSYTEDLAKYGDEYDDIVTLTVAASPLWCGMWFCITGAVGTCISPERANTLHFLKIAFLVLNVLCSSLFGPVCAVINGLISVKRHNLDYTDIQWLLMLVVCFLGILEIVIAIVGASVTCCCSPLRSTKVHVIVNTREDDTVRQREPAPRRQPSSVNHERWTSPKRTAPVSREHREREHVEHTRELNIQPHRTPPEMEEVFPRRDGFGAESPGNASYAKLKKWALPHW